MTVLSYVAVFVAGFIFGALCMAWWMVHVEREDRERPVRDG